MANVESSYTIPDAGLEFYTDLEARSLDITLTDRISHFGIFSHWEFEVTDEEKNTFKWKDFAVATDADKATVKAAIYHHVTNYIKKIPTTVDTPPTDHFAKVVVEDKGLNEKL
tara:strand:- start:3537 stop:3875 length:339 start_codon:yes stop_codon:yes gene_type:complete